MGDHVCPPWIGYLLASPLRRIFHNPQQILGPHVTEGMRVLDIGCAMGFFSLPLARLVGTSGKVYSVDLQEKMIRSLERRAHKAGLADRIQARTCKGDSLELGDLAGQIDFALAFAVFHEVPDRSKALTEIHAALKPSARLLAAEPRKRVSEGDFKELIAIAEKVGYSALERANIKSSHAVLFERAGNASAE